MSVIALCGSMRFREQLLRLETELVAAGHVVLAPVVPDPGVDLTEPERARLGREHLARVAAAHEVVVVDVGGHVGESTRREVAHARSLGIPVRFVEPPSEPVG